MTALTSPRDTIERNGDDFVFPVAAGKKIYAGALVALDAAGNLTPGAEAATLHGAAVARKSVDNSSGAAGAEAAPVKRGCFRFGNSAGADELTRADVGKDCYIVDDQTVAKTSNTNARSKAGIVRDVDVHGVWVEF